MTTLRTLQALLALSGVFGLWYSMSRRSKPAATWHVIVTATLSAVALAATQVAPLVWLTLFGITTNATITRVECTQGQKHYVHFEFVAGSQVQNGVKSASFGPPCESLQVGASGIVTYLPAEPEVHAWGNLNQQLADNMSGLLFVALAFPLVVHVGMRWRARRSGADG